MIDTLKGLLDRTVSPQGFIPVMQEQHSELVTAARDRLKAAMKACDAAAAALAESESALERVQQLIAAADDADAVLQTAEANSAAFTQAWAESGARRDRPQTDTKLKAKADTASRKSIAARIAADGAKAGLPVAETALRDAQNALHSADETIRGAVTALLVAMIENRFNLAAKAAADFDDAAHEIQACAKSLAGRFRPFSSDSTAAGLLNRLQILAPQTPRQDTRQLIQRGDDLLERSREFVDLGTRLLTDADAV